MKYQEGIIQNAKVEVMKLASQLEVLMLTLTKVGIVDVCVFLF